MDRRRFMMTATAAGAVASGPALADAGADAKLAALLDQQARALRDEAGGQGRLRDYSLAGRAKARAASADRLAQLLRIDRTQLSPSSAIDYDTARFVHEAMVDQYGRYGFSDINLRPSPYVVSQMNGAYYWLPDGIGRAAVASEQDAQRHLDRLSQFAAALDQETEQTVHDAGLGVIAPGFILDKTLAQLSRLRDAPAADNPLTGGPISRARAAGLNDAAQRIASAFDGQVKPALTRQIEALKTLRPRADDHAGVWAKPDGAAYYASALGSNTTAALAPGELHEQGKAWVADLTARIDALLRQQGLTTGSIAERMSQLDEDPRFLVPDSDAGREQILAYARTCLTKVQALLPRAFNLIPNDPVEVRRVPPAIENGSPGASYSGSDDPARLPAITINLRSVKENALWRLPTLLHHEGVPGHHFQASVLKRAGALSDFRRTVRFSAWTEGWALYAEQLADEIGAYDDNPVGRIGYLQGQLFRACRVVIDTGLHHARWPREQAIDWMVANAGEQRDAAEREIDRYCVYPGQACSFMVGKQQIVAAREAARRRLGGRFDLRAFNDLILASGPLPTKVLERMVEQWSPQPA
ncbi:DUF885 family protein [Caulobacter segnis]|uniref:DUF885 domain-containing protein n=1 Tax=Caulobacter segnis TaxID=88688 RepID=UPI00240F38EC|nr:DUF885 family protein [Caulobacter segnis]MDG2521888.1 DUF885 family protein [Caulobacter segnis]